MAVNLFNANFYRAANTDLASFNDAQALDHFQTFGLNEGRRFSEFADLNFYRSSNSDLAGFNNQEAFNHLQNNGIAEGRRFSQFVDLGFYRSNNSDLSSFNNEQIFEHLRGFGVNEGRRFSQFVDLGFYRNNNADLALFSNSQNLQHLEIFGLNEGRQFSVDFNVRNYLSDANNPDLKNFNNSQGYNHFVLFGSREGRYGGGEFAGNTLSTARNITISSTTTTFRDFVGSSDTNDYYRFDLNQASNFNLSLTGLGANADVELVSGLDPLNILNRSTASSTTPESVSSPLLAGTYYIRVFPGDGAANTSYRLNLSASEILPL